MKSFMNFIFSNSSFDNSTDDNKERKSCGIKYPRNKCRQKKKSGKFNKTKRPRLDDVKSADIHSRDKNALHSLSVNGTTTGNSNHIQYIDIYKMYLQNYPQLYSILTHKFSQLFRRKSFKRI